MSPQGPCTLYPPAGPKANATCFWVFVTWAPYFLIPISVLAIYCYIKNIPKLTDLKCLQIYWLSHNLQMLLYSYVRCLRAPPYGTSPSRVTPCGLTPAAESAFLTWWLRVPRCKRWSASPLKAWTWKSQKATSVVFYWAKQATRPAHIEGGWGIKSSTLWTEYLCPLRNSYVET